MESKEKVIARFDDKRNINIGIGRIIWGPATVTESKQVFHEGWVLPGGRRTLDRQEAETAARVIDAGLR
jgi:hypothetical protein